MSVTMIPCSYKLSSTTISQTSSSMSLPISKLSKINLTIMPIKFAFSMYLILFPLTFVFVTMCPHEDSKASSNIVLKFAYVYTSVRKLNFTTTMLFPFVKITEIYKVLCIFCAISVLLKIFHIPFITSSVNTKILYMPGLYIIFPNGLPNITIIIY